MATHKLAILVSALGAAKAAKDLRGVDKAISGIGAKGGKGLRTAGDNLRNLGIGAAGLAAAGLVASVKVAGDFEASLNTINTVAKLTSTQLEQVGSDIRGLARDTGTSVSDLSTAYYDLVSAGIKPGADALKVLTLANTLAIGGLATTGETVDLLTSAINTYRLSASDAAKATDMFAEAIALGKVTASEIATSFATVGSVAQAAGIGIDEISAAYAQLTARGIPAAEAMTQMRSAIVALQKPTPALLKAQDKLGISFAKLARTKGLQVAMQKLTDYSKRTGVPMAKLMGRIEGVNYALSVTDKNAADYNKALASVRAATGVAADQMSERQKGLNYQLQRLGVLANDAGITLGSKLLPKLTPLAEKAVAFLETHQSDIDKFGDNIAGAFDKAADFAARIPWGAIGSGLQMAAEWSGRLMDAFKAMPPQMQATIIALAGLNKLSGGAITGIVGELGKGLIKGVLGMNAAVVNINAGTVNGPGGPGGIPVGAPGGTPGPGGIIKPPIGAVVALDPESRATLDRNAKAFGNAVHNNGVDNRSFIEKFLHPFDNKPTPGLTGGAPGRGGTQNGSPMKGWAEAQKAWIDNGTKITDLQHGAVSAIGDVKDTTAKVGEQGRMAVDAHKQVTAQQGQNTTGAVRSGTAGTTAATNSGASRIVGAIASNRPIVTTSVKVYVTPAAVTSSTSTSERYGNTTGTGGTGSNGTNKVS